MTDLSASAPALDLAVRVARLERSNRRYRLTAAAACVGALAWTACAADAGTTLAAERFVLRGEDGSERATLELDAKGNPMLLLRNGEASALLTTNGPSLLLRASDGKTGAFVGVDSRNVSSVSVTSSRILDGVRLVAHEDGSSGVYVLDVNGRERGALESLAAGTQSLQIRDSQGRIRAEMGLDPESLPHLILLDERQQRRMGMLVQEDGNAVLEIADGEDRTRGRLTTGFDGAPRLEFLREDGTRSFEAP